ncbi:hypothetical protein SAMD00019534_003920 [Acytostelium subglobosum LB1]|uniref:hypothetical protein n=1 Tax=Acytostelium subglobosum LB1 TaxID=1410327 RepID=UPI000644C80F|nr:hypothetical protein SAMD00019534_003920 [Acytostelium subglobosum LB1]GAM17217.1 hypothetical protein SAMD00019534_003920 [Acytostelium subglobosum LB1]|eukprot:XP_012759279.1 hypothetical protein SAMD00019534_003920 [Acytostelium subglobosum LB1]
MDSDTLQEIFVGAFHSGDTDTLRHMIEKRLDDISVTRPLWQTIAKIGDPGLFESMVALHRTTKEGRTRELSLLTLATRLSVDASIWGQLELLVYLIQTHKVDMDQQQVEYLVSSATFNGNSDIVQYLMDNYKVSKKTQASLMKHAINYKHFDLVRLYHQHYSIPIDKKLIKTTGNCTVESFKKPNKKKMT